MKTGSQLIAEERERQVSQEGWSAAHDNQHVSEELTAAAALYCMPPDVRDKFDGLWPWEAQYWKPTPDNRIRELTKAGALIAAEIDRLQRLKK